MGDDDGGGDYKEGVEEENSDLWFEFHFSETMEQATI